MRERRICRTAIEHTSPPPTSCAMSCSAWGSVQDSLGMGSVWKKYLLRWLSSHGWSSVGSAVAVVLVVVPAVVVPFIACIGDVVGMLAVGGGGRDPHQ